MSEPAHSPEGRIGKQILLPWSKAIEIAAKSIRVRFWRSMITMSSIVLAIAFLMSIWTSTAITAALKIGPEGSIQTVKAKLDQVRGVLAQQSGGAALGTLRQRFPDDLEDALAWNADQIEEKQELLEERTTTADEKKKLQAEIAELQAKAQPENQPELLVEYLKDRRHKLEAVKSDVDAELQREGAVQMGSEAEAEAEAEALQASVGSSLFDFIGQMTPTDTWLAILALLVCLVGIANAMFMTVQERFREIGTMKCLGALDGFIVKLFLLESSALGFIGTLMGIVLGMLLSSLRQLINYGGPTVNYYPIGNILLAGVLAAIVGLLLSIGAAIFPARRAARMEPVEAMRVEE
ncbi:MAG: FtsX-like permease family protein [Planctomycetota bacterium]